VEVTSEWRLHRSGGYIGVEVTSELRLHGSGGYIGVEVEGAAPRMQAARLGALDSGYMAVTWRLHGGYMAVTWRLDDGYMALRLQAARLGG
jgi:hypothetical protein